MVGSFCLEKAEQDIPKAEDKLLVSNPQVWHSHSQEHSRSIRDWPRSWKHPLDGCYKNGNEERASRILRIWWLTSSLEKTSDAKQDTALTGTKPVRKPLSPIVVPWYLVTRYEYCCWLQRWTSLTYWEQMRRMHYVELQTRRNVGWLRDPNLTPRKERHSLSSRHSTASNRRVSVFAHTWLRSCLEWLLIIYGGSWCLAAGCN